jgi:pimeloyl-ACP methyl ester carboxylesterase
MRVRRAADFGKPQAHFESVPKRTLRRRAEAVPFAAMPKKSPAARGPVNLRRAYIECRYGQMHVRTAFPSTGGFDERTALVCLHRAPASSRMYVPLLPQIGTERSVYAPDIPGYGESDPPPAGATVADYAAALGEMLDALRLREVDLLGHHQGAAVAAELAVSRPGLVRRLVCVGLPLGAVAAQSALPPAADGGHLAAEWQRLRAARGAGLPLAQLAEEFGDLLRAGARAPALDLAIGGWAAAERLRLVTQPTQVLRPKDELWEATGRGRTWLRGAEWRDLPDLGPGLIVEAAERVSAELRRFLDG